MSFHVLVSQRQCSTPVDNNGTSVVFYFHRDRPTTQHQKVTCLLFTAQDWKLKLNLEKKLQFPPHIIKTHYSLISTYCGKNKWRRPRSRREQSMRSWRTTAKQEAGEPSVGPWRLGVGALQASHFAKHMLHPESRERDDGKPFLSPQMKPKQHQDGSG